MPSFYPLSRFFSTPVAPVRRQAQAPRGLLLGLGLLLAPVASFAQYQANGSAVTSTTCSNGGYTLTTNTANIAGSVWNTNQISLANDFTLTGNVYLGTSDGGADGITFTLQSQSTTAVGGTGLNLGVSGINPAISVEIDTYQNDPTYDPPADHISIFQGGNTTAPLAFTAPDKTSVKNIAAAVDGSGNALDIENSTYYPFKVVWTASSKTLDVYFNNALRASYTSDIVANVFSNKPLVYWGFTGATGGATNQQEVCGLNMSATVPLPVVLTEFTAQAAGASTRLQWATASELNTARFEVQRSTDGQTYTQRGTLAAAGNSASTRYYTYQDTNLPTGTPTLYYRLRQVDQDGTVSFSPVRAVQTSAATLVVFPNPTRQGASVSGLAPYAPVQLLDALGRPVAQATADEAGQAKLLFAANQCSGVYVVRSGQQVLRLVVE